MEPTNAVLFERLEAMSGIVEVHHEENKEQHKEIIEQCKKTNGRVTSLEKVLNMAIGALIFSNVIVVPIILAFAKKYFGL